MNDEKTLKDLCATLEKLTASVKANADNIRAQTTLMNQYFSSTLRHQRDMADALKSIMRNLSR